MRDELTAAELSFLARHRLGPDDVFEARGVHQWLWMQQIKEENKTVALGSRCRSAGHRLRSRAGHCVQCDPKKLAFQARYRAEQYVYIAGSQSAEFIKSVHVEIVARGSSSYEMRVWRHWGLANHLFYQSTKCRGDQAHSAFTTVEVRCR